MTSPLLIAPRKRPGDPHVSRLSTPFALALAFSLMAAHGHASGSEGPRGHSRADEAGAARGEGLAGRQVALVTGSTSGLGREVALRLADRGAHVIVHGRDRERGEKVVAQIEARGHGSARFYPADFASLAEVRAFAEALLADYDRLDILINNAGIWRREREESADGHELHLAVNYLSSFLLTRLLLPLVIDSAPARIVNVASGAQAPIDFDDPMLERGYSDLRAYSQSKLAQILFTVDLAQELEGTGVLALSLHPASLMDTPMVLSRGIAARSSVEEGAEAVIHLATAPGLESGRYFDGLRPGRPHAQARDPEARARLRELSDRFTGLRH